MRVNRGDTNLCDWYHRAQAYPKVTCKLVRGWHGDNERWGRPGGLAGVGVSKADRHLQIATPSLCNSHSMAVE